MAKLREFFIVEYWNADGNKRRRKFRNFEKAAEWAELKAEEGKIRKYHIAKEWEIVLD